MKFENRTAVITGGAGNIGRAAAEVILFFASDETSFVTGCDYTVDGGRILGARYEHL